MQSAPREDTDEPAVLGHRHALEILVFEEAEGLVERQLGVERVPRRLGDLPHRGLRRVPPRGNDVANKRPARDHADELLVLANEYGPNLRPRQQLPGFLRGRVAAEGARLRQHRVSDPVAHGPPSTQLVLASRETPLSQGRRERS